MTAPLVSETYADLARDLDALINKFMRANLRAEGDFVNRHNVVQPLTSVVAIARHYENGARSIEQQSGASNVINIGDWRVSA
jgi:hypothetical protein